ncbi:MAG: GGDEF domain-containing protein [bacterium]
MKLFALQVEVRIMGIIDRAITQARRVRHFSANLGPVIVRPRTLCLDPDLQVYRGRDFYLSLINKSIAHSLRTGKPFSLAFIDLDDFKVINELYGHETGNKVMRDICAAIRHSVGKKNMVFAYGGDEFLLLMPGLNSIQARELAELVGAAISRVPIIVEVEGRMENEPITASIGVVTFSKDFGWGSVEPEVLIEQADVLVYVAKRHGGNQVVFKK